MILLYKPVAPRNAKNSRRNETSLQVFREEMDLQPFLAKDHDLVVPKAPEIVFFCVCVNFKEVREDLDWISYWMNIYT